MTNFFLRNFPPPKWLEIPAFGLDISDRSFKFVELRAQNGRLALGRFGRKAVGEGILQSGEIKNKDALIELLASSFHSMRGEAVAVSLPEEKAFVGSATLPKMAPGEVREALEVGLEEYIPLPAGEAVFDFEIVKTDENLDHTDVVIVAFPRSLVQNYLEVVKAAGLRPSVFQMEVHALARATLAPDSKESAMLVDFGRTRTSFIIVSGGMVRFTSTVALAGEELDRAISKTLGVDVFEAERLKKEWGLVRASESKKIFDALLPTVSSIKDEISRHLIFWKSHAQHLHVPSPEVRQIYLAGGDANLRGFSEYLSYEFKLPVKLANPWVNITDFENYIPEITYRESLSYGTALGLALAVPAQK